MANCALTVHIATKLNRSHLCHGREALILPCLGRTERDTTSTGDQDMAVLRFNTNGALDTTFGNFGKATIDFDQGGGKNDYARAVAVQPDGKIVVAGSADGNFALARYAADGTPDSSFSGDGLVTTDLGGTDAGQGVAIQADGKIVVVGSSGGNFALARHSASGVLDPSFSGDGLIACSFLPSDRRIRIPEITRNQAINSMFPTP